MDQAVPASGQVGAVDVDQAVPAFGQIDGGGNVGEPDELQKTIQAIQELKKSDDKEALSRLFSLLESQKVQQQAILSRMQSRQQQEDAKEEIMAAVYNRDLPKLRLLLQQVSDSAIVSMRDEEGMTLCHHAVRLGMYELLQWVMIKAPALADSVTNPSGRPGNWTPLMVLVDAPPGTLGGRQAACEMLKMLTVHMSATGLQLLGVAYLVTMIFLGCRFSETYALNILPLYVWAPV